MEASLGSLTHPFPVSDEGTLGLGVDLFLSIAPRELAAGSCSAFTELGQQHRESAPLLRPPELAPLFLHLSL